MSHPRPIAAAPTPQLTSQSTSQLTTPTPQLTSKPTSQLTSQSTPQLISQSTSQPTSQPTPQPTVQLTQPIIQPAPQQYATANTTNAFTASLPLQSVGILPATNTLSTTTAPDGDTSDQPPNKKQRRQSSRAGAPNYTEQDVNELLHIVEEVIPIGANDWSRIRSEFNDWANQHDRPSREAHSLKSKFDKLAAMKSSPHIKQGSDNVRRAKQVSRAIQTKCAATVLGESDEDDAQSSQQPHIGSRANIREFVGKKKMSPRKTSEDQWLDKFSVMTDHIKTIAESVRRPEDEKHADVVTVSEVETIVDKQVGSALQQTNATLKALADMLAKLTEKVDSMSKN